MSEEERHRFQPSEIDRPSIPHLPVADMVRQTGISEQTFYRWKKQYAGLESTQVGELKQLSEENARLKKLVADLSLDKAVLQDVLSKKFPGHRS